MIDRAWFEEHLRSCTAKQLWGAALTIFGGVLLLVGGIGLLASEAPGNLTLPLLVACGLTLVTGIVLLVQARSQWQPVRAALPLGQTAAFQSGWADPLLRFGPDGWACLTADGGCLCCAAPAPANAQTRRALVSARAQQAQSRRHLMFGIIGAATVDTKDKKGRQEQGIPLDAKGLQVAYAVCEACKQALPNLKWTGWAALGGTVVSLAAAAVLILTGAGGSSDKALALQVIGAAVPFLAGGSLGLGGLAARGLANPLRFKKVDVNEGVVIELPKHLTLRAATPAEASLPK